MEIILQLVIKIVEITLYFLNVNSKLLVENYNLKITNIFNFFIFLTKKILQTNIKLTIYD
ncbi:MAG: hypothetical protein CMM44_12000 [Rhodospirillaceae bacterium]|nr:hypothetical protein [Rhodospirillaceae bacterium]